MRPGGWERTLGREGDPYGNSIAAENERVYNDIAAANQAIADNIAKANSLPSLTEANKRVEEDIKAANERIVADIRGDNPGPVLFVKPEPMYITVKLLEDDAAMTSDASKRRNYLKIAQLEKIFVEAVAKAEMILWEAIQRGANWISLDCAYTTARIDRDMMINFAIDQFNFALSATTDPGYYFHFRKLHHIG